MSDQKIFEASPESKTKAKQYRVIAVIAWIIAIAAQIYAILKLLSNETMTWLIVAIVVILILAVTANILWKKANKLDPASEKNKTKFFIQNQLGAIMGVLAFLPLVILIFTNKDLNGKTKGIAGSIAVIALLIAGVSGVEFNPASIEKYTEEINAQTETLKDLDVGDNVFWSKAGNKYHIDSDCYHIKGKQLSNGTVKESWEQKGISELCKTCRNRATKVKKDSAS
ncbi:MAG: hypothetical protein EVB11_03035 [Winogradskyella sp.]|nr:MAG: hypothetical protein EVB11_03035 [Winogradskyella sp.]